MRSRHLALTLGACLLACSGRPRATSDVEAIPNRPLVPAPARMVTKPGASFRVNAKTRVSGPREVASQVERWFGLPGSATGEPGAIELRLVGADASEPAVDVPSIEAQSFTLEVDEHHAVVTSAGRAGLFYGAQTLAQLAGARFIGRATEPVQNERYQIEYTIPPVRIEDRPRSRFRVMHLDVVRHFFDRATVERYVDLLAFYRFNVFHWHLVDDQGFRLPLARHPEIVSANGAYTREEVASVINTARERFVTVVPEVEMPGHARAILAAHPELSCTGEQQTTPTTEWGIFEDVLCAGNPRSFELMADILTEVAWLFPSKYIHVGGDEVPDTRWNACPKCQAAMKQGHLDAPGLERLFMQGIYTHLAALNRRPMVWDEALPDHPGQNPPVVVAWQSKARGDLAVSRGFDTIYAPYQTSYFNIHQSGRDDVEPGANGLVSLAMVKTADPGVGPHILGGEGALWSEFIWSPEDIDQMVMPRLAGLADVLWSGSQADFESRFASQYHLKLLDQSRVHYFVAPPTEPDGRRLRTRRVVLDETYATLEAPPLLRARGAIRYTRDGSAPVYNSPRYRDPLQITGDTTIRAAFFLGEDGFGRSSPVVQTKFVKETPRPARAPRTSLNCTYYEGEFHRLSQVPAMGTGGKAVVPRELAIDAVLAAAETKRTDHFAFRCTSSVDVAETGVTRFLLHADDGVRLTVDGEKVVEIDNELGPRDAEGEIALAKGAHDLDVVYFQGTEGKAMTITRAPP